MPSGVFVASEGFAPAHNFVQPTGFQYDSSALGPPDGQPDCRYGSSALGPPDGLPYSQAGWQPAQVAVSDMNNMNMFQGGNLGFQNAAPTGLEYWDWQGLGVGHPVSWGESSMQVNEGFDNRKTASDRPESSVADKSPKSR